MTRAQIKREAKRRYREDRLSIDSKRNSLYPADCDAVFNAAYQICNNALLVSQCQDFISILEANGYHKLSEVERLKLDTLALLQSMYNIFSFSLDYTDELILEGQLYYNLRSLEHLFH